MHAEIAAIQKMLPPGVDCSPSTISPRSSTIPSRACATPSDRPGSSPLIILVLFLRDWGTSLVAGLVIPATVADHFHRTQSISARASI